MGEEQNVDEKVVDVFFAIVWCLIGRHLSSIYEAAGLSVQEKD